MTQWYDSFYQGNLEWVMSHSQRSYMNESWHTRSARTCLTWLILSWRPWMSHVTLTALVYEWVIYHSQRSSIKETLHNGWHAVFACVTLLIHMCAIRVPWLVWADYPHSSDETTFWERWHDLFTFVTSLIHTCDMTHLCELTVRVYWGDLWQEATWLIHICDMTHPYVGHDSFVRTSHPRLLRRPFATCDMTH